MQVSPLVIPPVHAETPADDRSPLAPVFVWVAWQLTALGMSAARVPFYATKSFPQPAELLALPLMLTVQIGVSALLFPFLLRDVRAAGLVIVSSWPMTVLAGFLTGLPNPRGSAASAAMVSLWLIGLALWRPALCSPRLKAAGILGATLLALAAPIVQYLRFEYGDGQGGSIAELALVIPHAITVSGTGATSHRIWVAAGVHAFAGIVALSASKLYCRSPHPPRSTVRPAN